MNVLLIGCGSKFGLKIVEYFLSIDANVHSISGSELPINNANLMHRCINWKTVNIGDIELFLRQLPVQDFILFNQNGSSLATQDFITPMEDVVLWELEHSWAQTNYTSCILPYHIIKTLGNRCNASTKVAWMLSSLIYKHGDVNQIGHADYCANKYQNYLIMKNFSLHHSSCFFGIDPGSLSDADLNVEKALMTHILSTDCDTLNGSYRRLDFTINDSLAMFGDGSSSSDAFDAVTRNIVDDSTEVALVHNKPVMVTLGFQISVVNDESITMQIGERTYANLLDGQFKCEVEIIFPSDLHIQLSNRNENDTIVDNDGNIIKDKSIVLTDISIHGVCVDHNYLEQFILLTTTEHDTLHGNYWSRNGMVTIDFNTENEFLWFVCAKEKLNG